MNPELEALIKAFDAAIQAQGAESERLRAIYESLLADALQRHPNVSFDTLKSTVRLAHRRWVKAQKSFLQCRRKRERGLWIRSIQ